MGDDRKGELLGSLLGAASLIALTHACAIDDEATIKVASKKTPQASKLKPGKLRFKKKASGVKEAGDYEGGIAFEGTFSKQAHGIFPLVFHPMWRAFTDCRGD